MSGLVHLYPLVKSPIIRIASNLDRGVFDGLFGFSWCFATSYLKYAIALQHTFIESTKSSYESGCFYDQGSVHIGALPPMQVSGCHPWPLTRFPLVHRLYHFPVPRKERFGLPIACSPTPLRDSRWTFRSQAVCLGTAWLLIAMRSVTRCV